MYQEVQFITSFGKSSIHLGLLLNLLFYIMLCWMYRYIYTSSVLSSFYLPWPKIIYARCPIHIFPVMWKKQTNEILEVKDNVCIFFFYNYTTSTMDQCMTCLAPFTVVQTELCFQGFPRKGGQFHKFLMKETHMILNLWRKKVYVP